jgi:hypothetical protein
MEVSLEASYEGIPAVPSIDDDAFYSTTHGNLDILADLVEASYVNT